VVKGGDFYITHVDVMAKEVCRGGVYGPHSMVGTYPPRAHSSPFPLHDHPGVSHHHHFIYPPACLPRPQLAPGAEHEFTFRLQPTGRAQVLNVPDALDISLKDSKRERTYQCSTDGALLEMRKWLLYFVVSPVFVIEFHRHGFSSRLCYSAQCLFCNRVCFFPLPCAQLVWQTSCLQYFLSLFCNSHMTTG
jgi:hypothetical protein